MACPEELEELLEEELDEELEEELDDEALELAELDELDELEEEEEFPSPLPPQAASVSVKTASDRLWRAAFSLLNALNGNAIRLYVSLCYGPFSQARCVAKAEQPTTLNTWMHPFFVNVQTVTPDYYGVKPGCHNRRTLCTTVVIRASLHCAT